VGGQRHASAALPPGKTRYPLYRRLGGPLKTKQRMQLRASARGQCHARAEIPRNYLVS
jgi:hypothetical protein